MTVKEVFDLRKLGKIEATASNRPVCSKAETTPRPPTS